MYHSTRYVYQRRPIYHRSYYYGTWCWWIMWLLIFGFLITFLVLAITAPQHSHGYYYKTPNNDTTRTFSGQCKVGERFDDDVELCAPITNTPTPILPSMVDQSVRPCDSFYNYMCGSWIKNHTNEDRAFSYVYRKNRKQVHDIIKDPRSGPIYNFYRSCLDTIVNKKHSYETHKQIEHVKQHILSELRTHADLPVVLARLAKLGFSSVFSMSIETHPTEFEMIPLFRYDTVPNLETSLTRQLNLWHAEMEDDDISFMDYVQGPKFKDDLVPMKELVDAAPANFWRLFLREINGVSALEADLIVDAPGHHQMVWVMDKNYFRKLLKQMNTFPIAQWKEFVKASIEYNMKNFLPAVPSDVYFRVHEKKPIGTQIHLDHKLKKHDGEYTEEQCLAVTHKLLPGIIAKEFLRRDMPDSEQIRAQIRELVQNLKASYAFLIEQTPWMSAETKQKAVDKIRAIIVRVIHPTTFDSEPFANRLTQDRYLRNIDMVRRYRVQRNYELWTATRKKMSRDVIQRFGAPATTVNAYYSPVTNTITVFAGIVRAPFFDRNFSPASLHATLGLIVGHELSHCMDNTGRQFNAEGSLVEWWAKKDVDAFNKKTQCIVKEYPSPAVCPVIDNYGQKTLGENIADINGLSIAWDAFLRAHPEAGDAEKREFFEVFAQMWAASYDNEHKCAQIKRDVHSIAQFRVDRTLRQMKAFGELFNCHKSDRMVNEKRCKIYG